MCPRTESLAQASTTISLQTSKDGYSDCTVSMPLCINAVRTAYRRG